MATRQRSPLFLLAALLLIPVAVVLWFTVIRSEGETAAEIPLWTVDRGPLRVTVLEGGSLEALESHTVVSRVEGQAAILSIVDEGSVITPEDVEAGRLLVQLDSSGIEESLERQKIDLASARAAHENAVSNLEIQLQENASALRKAELDVRFALLDLSRYVGRTLVDELQRVHRGGDTEGGAGDGSARAPAVGLRRFMLTLLENEQLEGEARQTIRQLDSDIRLAEEEFQRAQVKFDWSERLEEKGYVSREEKEADRIARERWRIELDRARIARDQFAQYDFPKEVERLLSNLVEAEDQLSRTLKRARSAEAMAQADVESRSEQRTLQEGRHRRLLEQLDACVIRAEKPGLVVYASSGRRRRWDRGERIQEGTSVRERQPIITIPDLSQLGVKADIHESVVERVQPGQSVTVVVDALPDQPLRGAVKSVAPLPNPAESWFNPDRKVYATSISLEAVPPTVRPGMSAQVEILVADLADVLRAPVQTVAGSAEQPTVWVWTDDGEATQRPVVLGLSNDRYVQVLEGLAAGERILLAPPRQNGLGGEGAAAEGEGEDKARPGRRGERRPPEDSKASRRKTP